MNNHGVRKRTFYFRLYADTDTVIAVSRPGVADKTITSGTDESVPYMVRRKTQLRTCVTRNVTVSTIVPNRVTRDICIRSGPNSPLKIKTGTVDTVPVFLNAYYQSCF